MALLLARMRVGMGYDFAIFERTTEEPSMFYMIANL
jgi:hypothetical protein